MRTTISVPEISERLGICEETVYEMLRDGSIPNMRYGRRFIISRFAYERWEANIGEKVPAPVVNEPKSIEARSSAAPRNFRPVKIA